MSYIYKISNDINDKVYIGKTSTTIQQRFQEHLQAAKRQSLEKRPLYNAINKYGSEHFKIEIIEECPIELDCEREKYWIEFYHSYKYGYNATLGGDGKYIYNHEEIAQYLKEHPYLKETANYFDCSTDLVSIVAKEYHIETFNKGQESFIERRRVINQYNKQEQFIQQFNSIQQAAEWLMQQHIITTISSGVRGHICDVANGKRKSAYGYIWKYPEH